MMRRNVLFAVVSTALLCCFMFSNVAVVGEDSDRLLVPMVFGGPPYNFVVRQQGRMRDISAYDVIWKFQTPLGSAVYEQPTVGDVDGDGVQNIVFGNHGGYLYCIDAFGNEKWRINTTQNMVIVTPALADLNDDGNVEILFTNGSRLDCLDGKGNLLWSHTMRGGGYQFPTVADITGDGRSEIVISSRSSHMTFYLLDNQGNKLWELSFEGWAVRPPSIIDLDGNGLKEILISVNETFGRGTTGIYSIKTEKSIANDGSTVYTPTISMFHPVEKEAYSTIIIDDIDGDGNEEIIFYSWHTIYVLNKNGDVKESYTLDGLQHRGLTIADINQNGRKEILISSLSGRKEDGARPPRSAFNTTCIDQDGTILWSHSYGVPEPPVVADLNGDGKMEIFSLEISNIYSRLAKALIYSHKGEILWEYNSTEWLDDRWSPRHPIIADINGDGILEILTVSGSGLVVCFGLKEQNSTTNNTFYIILSAILVVTVTTIAVKKRKKRKEITR